MHYSSPSVRGCDNVLVIFYESVNGPSDKSEYAVCQ
nr:MAG TPA: hypothetical protein [Caudoviricetes sp.]